MNTNPPEFLRRIGPSQKHGNPHCVALENCPDLWEATDGSFIVIGRDVTAQVAASLPTGVGCGSDERIIVIPRKLLLEAKSHLPDV